MLSIVLFQPPFDLSCKRHVFRRLAAAKAFQAVDAVEESYK